MENESDNNHLNKPLWGVLGGSFDPVHLGHVATAQSVLEQLQLEKILFVPAARSPFKGQSRATDAHREKMLTLALADHAQLELDGRELQRPAPSYTVDTIEALVAQYPDRVWVLILGIDAWRDFFAWHHPKRILELVHVAVMSRAGHSHPEFEAARPLAEQADLLRPRVIDEGAGSGVIVHVKVPDMDISSTDIRARLAQGKSTTGHLDAEVERYITSHGLYR